MVLQICTRSVGILEFNALLLKLVSDFSISNVYPFKFHGFASWIRCALVLASCTVFSGMVFLASEYPNLPVYTVEKRQFASCTRFETLGEGRFLSRNIWRCSRESAEANPVLAPTKKSLYWAAEPANDSVMGTVRPQSCPILGDSGLGPIPLNPYQFDSSSISYSYVL
jgi:hypothetical protein